MEYDRDINGTCKYKYCIIWMNLNMTNPFFLLGNYKWVFKWEDPPEMEVLMGKTSIMPDEFDHDLT
jgi:hypothetical protein